MVKEIRSKILTIIKNKNKPISKDFKEQYNYYRKNHITSPKRKKKNKIQALQRADIPVNKCRNKKTSRP